YLRLQEAVRELELTLSLTVQQTTIRLLTAVGFREIGILRNYVRPLRPERMLVRLDPSALGLTGISAPLRAAVRLARLPVASALAGLAARFGLGIWATLNGRPGRALHGRGRVLDASLDALWCDCRDTLGCGGGRDSAYLTWRYDTSPTGPYRSAAVTEGGALRGVVMVRAPRSDGDPRLSGIRVATLSDLVYDPARLDVGLALLAQAERVAQ